MVGLGTIINSAAIVAGGLAGNFISKLFRQDQQDAVSKACGISVMFIAIAGAMQGMLYIDHGRVLSGKSMLVVLCIALGTIVGEIIGIEKGFGQTVCDCICNSFSDGMYRCNGYCRRNPGWNFRGLFDTCRKISSGLYYYRSNDVLNGKRMYVLGDSCSPSGRSDYIVS